MDGNQRSLPERPRPSGRNLPLDGVRGAAIVLVLIGHTVAALPGAAIVGVDLFFVLSGYLITTRLLREARETGGVRLRSFYCRRALRLLPALTVMLAVYATLVMLTTAGATRAADLRSAGLAFAYVTNFAKMLGHDWTWAMGHTWSLALEEQFYLTWPVVLAITLSIKGRPIAARTVGWVILAAMALRWTLYVTGGYAVRSHAIYYAPVTWVDALLIGCWLASADPSAGVRKLLTSPHLTVPAAAVLAGVSIAPGPGMLYTGGLTLVAFACAALVAGAAEPMKGKAGLFSNPVVVHLGVVSYGLYLWHFPILWWAWQVTGHPPTTFVTAVLAISASIAAAEVSYRFVEAPFLAMKDRHGRRVDVSALAAEPAAG